MTNTGQRAGDEVVQLYTHQRDSRDTQPIKQLRAFERVSLEPGETTTVDALGAGRPTWRTGT